MMEISPVIFRNPMQYKQIDDSDIGNRSAGHLRFLNFFVRFAGFDKQIG